MHPYWNPNINQQYVYSPPSCKEYVALRLTIYDAAYRKS